jgi:serine/threonine protein kinase/predicted ATPase
LSEDTAAADSWNIGPYRVLEKLGQGGMGAVYRAVHADTGAVVAIKTVLVPHEGMLQAIRREIHALARLRHPGIVPIVAEGLHKGLPWYAMELIEGRTLRDYARRVLGRPAGAPEQAEASGRWWTLTLEEARAAPVPAGPSGQVHPPERRLEAAVRPALPGGLAPLLSVVRRLCEALSYLHGEGLVHRDLKPENVLVGGRGQEAGGRRQAQEAAPPPASCLLPIASAWPVLMDFGIASSFAATLSREALEVGGRISGTVTYMAPEQGRGELVDARADLYSLGCILYELVAGRPPFTGAVPLQVLYQHFAVEPAAPSELVGDVPPELDALILRLLAKEPHRRLGHADDVAAVLAKLLARDEPAAAGGPVGPRPRAYLYRPRLVGRDQPLAELERHLESAQSGAGRLVLIGGESGVGKTRLVMELARQAQAQELNVLAGECSAGGAPLHPLRRALQAVADRCRELDASETERRLGRRGKVLAPYEPALASLSGLEAHSRPAELPPELARLRLFHDLAETLAAFADGRALLLVLDDLHWADELTLGFLRFVQRLGRLERAGILVLGTYRSEEVGEPLRSLIESAEARMELARLDEAAVGSMVCDMLALDAAPQLFQRFLAGQSEGNAFFVAEYLRAAVAEGLLYRDAAGRWQVEGAGEEAEASQAVYLALPLPRSLRDLVRQRLEGLPAPARRLVDTAAVLGREADLGLLGDLSGLDGQELEDALDELLRRQVLEQPAAETVRFVHDKIREVAYEQSGEDRRRQMHRAAAQAIESRLEGRLDDQMADLGRHWDRAGVPEKARTCYLAAARLAAARYAHEEAERLYEAVLGLTQRPTRETVAARNEMAQDVLAPRGRVQEAIEELRRALDESLELQDPVARGQVLQGLGALHRDIGQVDEARRLLQEALELQRRNGERAAVGRILGNLAVLAYEQDRMDEARGLFHEALELHRETGNRLREGQTLVNLANVEEHGGRMEPAQGLYERALGLLREAGDRRSEAIALGNLANLQLELGRMEEARGFFEQALAIAREIGDRRQEGVILGNFAAIDKTCGRSGEALALYEQVLSLHRDLGNRRLEGNVLQNLANLHHELGRPIEALALYEQALELHRETGGRSFEAVNLRGMATIERRCRGDLDAARRLLDEAEAVDRQVGSPLDRLVYLCERGHLELARGRCGRGPLEEAESLSRSLGLGPSSEARQVIEHLRRAQESFEAGLPLFRGERREDLPEALRLWLDEHSGR